MCNIKQAAESIDHNKRTVAIGVQDFEQLVSRNCFYVDKTKFIKEWWENEDSVTLITRPRRFGKTLTLNMMERFFSIKYAGQGELFEGLDIWKEEKYRKLQGTCPVIGLTFAAVKQTNYSDVKQRICQIITDVYQECYFVRDSEALTDVDRAYFDRISPDMQESDATYSLHKLSQFLSRYYGRKVLILLDEYDTPMQEAYVGGFWDEMVSFIRSLFNATFKTNPYLERAVLTGITRISKESIFSDLNNLEVVSSTSEKYADVFGFTEEEVFAAMDEQGLPDKDMVKKWYDGFTFGKIRDIYNPWSIINYLDKRKLGAYWANTSSNSLVAMQLKQADIGVKKQFEGLLQGEALEAEIDEEIVFGQLDRESDAIWSLLLASGYLKVLKVANPRTEEGQERYTLGITNLEVRGMFGKLIRGWFAEVKSDYNAFVKALLQDDVEAMNDYMNEVTDEILSSFDTGRKPSGKSQPERFYHGFVLGLLVELQGEYRLRSNRESGFGRYDVMLEPLDVSGDGIIIEFKVRRPEKEAGLEETVAAALRQIEEKHYEQELLSRGVAPEKIRKYGFAFEGKKVLIGGKAGPVNLLKLNVFTTDG